MGKYAPDATLDQELDYIALSDYMCACSGSPTTFSDAYTNLMLAKVAMSAGDFTKGNDVNGRKVTMSAKTSVPITNSGTCLAVALVNASASSLRFVTTATSQVLTAGGTVDFPAGWKINIQTPV
jgi:hypothetical protein